MGLIKESGQDTKCSLSGFEGEGDVNDSNLTIDVIRILTYFG